MLEFVLIVFLVVWLVLAIRSIKKGKNRCSGDCLNCHNGTNLCEQYGKDHPKKTESR